MKLKSQIQSKLMYFQSMESEILLNHSFFKKRKTLDVTGNFSKVYYMEKSITNCYSMDFSTRIFKQFCLKCDIISTIDYLQINLVLNRPPQTLDTIYTLSCSILKYVLYLVKLAHNAINISTSIIFVILRDSNL
ncbi:hypothetical protein WA026_010449 [Henosepilachna vigintioctopunctata]|uniref:Uncharacterized protein n=1 Tax=Henosepilachna vigintioctopunctata TaxID=420089 RepID=A0AAW1VEB6_9CUCU